MFGDGPEGKLETRVDSDVVWAVAAVVDAVAEDLTERGYSRDGVRAARDRGEYLALFARVQQRLQTLGSLPVDELRSEARRGTREWLTTREATVLCHETAPTPSSYEVECWLASDPPDRPSLRKATVPGTQTEATFEGLPAGRWLARVRAVGAAGPGQWSGETETVVPGEERE